MNVNLKEMLEVLRGLKRGDECYCEMAIGNPMCHSHSAACNKAMALEKKLEQVVELEKVEIHANRDQGLTITHGDESVSFEDYSLICWIEKKQK